MIEDFTRMMQAYLYRKIGLGIVKYDEGFIHTPNTSPPPLQNHPKPQVDNPSSRSKVQQRQSRLALLLNGGVCRCALTESAGHYMVVGIKSILNAASITDAHIRVNAA
ncbi:hypothetical protein Tco_0271971 [Tanacetum coccineum]